MTLAAEIFIQTRISPEQILEIFALATQAILFGTLFWQINSTQIDCMACPTPINSTAEKFKLWTLTMQSIPHHWNFHAFVKHILYSFVGRAVLKAVEKAFDWNNFGGEHDWGKADQMCPTGAYEFCSAERDTQPSENTPRTFRKPRAVIEGTLVLEVHFMRVAWEDCIMKRAKLSPSKLDCSFWSHWCDFNTTLSFARPQVWL